MEKCDIAIIGAGPYGLSAAAHLRELKGLDVRLFGDPMSFWRDHMPEGMVLRSPWVASHLADPRRQFTLDSYRRCGNNFSVKIPSTVRDPRVVRDMSAKVPLQDFVKYGLWFQENAALPSDSRKVLRVGYDRSGFRLVLEDGQELFTPKVVVAGGIQPFTRRPKIFDGLPSSLVTHASEKQDFCKFRGRNILIIGGGQSALESTILLNEAGASVETLVREPLVHWFGQKQWMHSRPIRWVFYGAADVGPAGISLFAQRPSVFRQLPRRLQDKWRTRAIRPGAACWVKERSQGLEIRTSRFVTQARVQGEKLCVRLNDGTERVVDHVVLGTGYQVNISLYSYLPATLLDRITQVDGYPCLNRAFETSVPGLYFLGAPAAWSFGPLMRFVAGATFAAPALARGIAASTKVAIGIAPETAQVIAGIKAARG